MGLKRVVVSRWRPQKVGSQQLASARMSGAMLRGPAWLAMGLAGGRRGRRAAMRGAMAVGVTEVVFRSERVASKSVVDSEAAAAGAFVAATALESLPWTAPATVLGLATIGASARRSGPAATATGAALGAAAALATLRWWPRIDTSPADAPPAPRRHRGAVDADGAGLTLVANPSAGPDGSDGPLEEIRQGLPAARVVALGGDDDLLEVLGEAAESAAALGILGGDGSINAAASVAMKHEIPLAVFPGGTLNHFARDLGLDTVADAIAAVTDGTVIEVDTASIADRAFLNTASLGSYPELVMARERLEDRIGKWPAMLVALIKVLRTATPTRITLNGERRDVWMIFIGNCAYDPAGFAPATRSRLDDRRLDVRLVDGSHPAARGRLMMSLLTGTLARSRVYERRLVDHLEICADGSSAMLATDGEAFDGPAEFVVAKHPRSLLVHAPTN